MFDQIELGREFFEGLMAIDAAILARAGREVCRFCGGPLHRGDYARRRSRGVSASAAAGRDAAAVPRLHRFGSSVAASTLARS
jgi:hypothetical protein